MTSPADPYDLVSYPAGVFDHTHPSRLATLATLFGMSPAPVERCRVLELGAGEGANLMPMAATLPGSTFTGIDRAAQPVAVAEAVRKKLGLDNARFEQRDILDFEPEPGGYDYILAHGVYSWVPDPVRARILEIIRRGLAPAGVAFISYNALPGCYQRQVTRDLMLYHTRSIEEPRRRVGQARAVVAFVAEHIAAAAGNYQGLVVGQRDRLGKLADEYVYHDDLGEINQPYYLHEFMHRAGEHGLRYLGEAVYAHMQDQMLPPDVRRMLADAGDIVAHDQYLDFIVGRAFRRTLLVHQEAELDRDLSGERARAFYVAANAEPAAPVDVQSNVPLRLQKPDGLAVGLTSPMAKAAMLVLCDASPAALSFDELCAATRARLGPGGEVDERELGELILTLYGGEMVQLYRHRLTMAVEPGERPLANRLARLSAAEGRMVIDLWHRAVKIDDPALLRLLALSDGSRDRAALAREMGGDVSVALAKLGRMALLEA